VAEIVVVGGGMAGAACASELAKHDVDVVLVDRENYLQFQPLLYQVASSQLPAEDVARPLRGVFHDESRVQVRTTAATAIDFAQRRVQLADGEQLTGDRLVLAAGAQPNFFGVRGAREYAFPLYSVPDAVRLRRHLRTELRAHPASSDTESDARSASQEMSVIIVGGGPTGVETAGAIGELVGDLKQAGRLEDSASVELVDHGSALLQPFSNESHNYAHDKLTEMGVKITYGVAVSGVTPQGVSLSDGGERASRTVIWAGGEAAASIAADTGANPGHGGRIDVDPELTVPGFEGVYAVGDVANIHDQHGHPLPQLGSVAQQAGRWAARNILAERKGKPTEPFRYRDKGIMAMIGRNAAIAEIGQHRHQLDGPVAFAAWLGVHAVLLSGVHSRVDAFLNWADDYLHHDRSADLELEGAPTRIAWGDDPGDRPTIVVDRAD
jgi:NADH:ubiquinone reductase (H+-translocating)